MEPSENMSPETAHRRAADTVAKFTRLLAEVGKQDEIKRALANTPVDITGNRTYMQIAIDDALNSYVTAAADVIRKTPGLYSTDMPVALYRELMEARLERSVTDDEAIIARGEAIAQKLETPAQTPQPPSFLSLLAGRVEEPEIIKLNAVWDTLLYRMERMIHAEVGVQPATQIFNRRAAAASATPKPAGLRHIGDAPAAQDPQANARPLPSGNNDNNLPVTVNYSNNLKTLLQRYGGEDFTDMARRKAADPVFGRKQEVGDLIDILLQKNNPIALMQGPSGIGTTSVVQALAQAVVEDKVPARLKDASVVSIKLCNIILVAASDIAAQQQGKPPQEVLKNLLNEIVRNNQTAQNKIVLHIEDLDTDTQYADPYIKQFAPMMRSTLAQAIDKSKGSLLLAMEANEKALPEIAKHDPIILKRCTKMTIKEMASADVMEFMKHRAVAIAEHNGVAKPDDALLEYIVDKTNRLVPAETQPVKAAKVLEMMAAHAEAAGKKTVSTDDADAVLSVITGLPLELVSKGIAGRILSLETELPKRILGQPEISKIIDKLIIANAGLKDPNRPMGCFLLPGPTGSGKTETGKALAEILGIEPILIDMTQFQDEHAKAKFIGAPPGYVGYNDEAEMEKVRKVPYCVLILDEIEKAHPAVFNLLLSAMEEGKMPLLNGEAVDLRNTILIMTSNIGATDAQQAKEVRKMGFGSKKPTTEEMNRRGEDAVQAAINKGFKPEFINRLDAIVGFRSLTDMNIVHKIALQQVEKVSKFLRQDHKNLQIELSPEAMTQLVDLGYSEKYNARPMRQAVENHIKTPLSRWLIKNGNSITQPSTFYIKSLGEVFDYEVRPQSPPTPPRLSLPAPAP